VVPDTPKSEIVFSSPHLTRNLRFQKENDDLVEEEHKTNSSLDSSTPLLIMDPSIFHNPS